jgi:two-component system chemotaxis response regulator CheY
VTHNLAFVIEDDYDAATIFMTALQKIGFDTEVIASGDKALERLQEATPYLIILDLHLPHVNGRTILQTIRADTRLNETIVIVATADPRMADLIRTQADLVLLKPTTFSQVRDLTARFVKKTAE